jgi:hypothetical protein
MIVNPRKNEFMADAVICELFSAKFPANRENTGNFQGQEARRTTTAGARDSPGGDADDYETREQASEPQKKQIEHGPEV